MNFIFYKKNTYIDTFSREEHDGVIIFALTLFVEKLRAKNHMVIDHVITWLLTMRAKATVIDLVFVCLITLKLRKLEQKSECHRVPLVKTHRYM